MTFELRCDVFKRLHTLADHGQARSGHRLAISLVEPFDQQRLQVFSTRIVHPVRPLHDRDHLGRFCRGNREIQQTETNRESVSQATLAGYDRTTNHLRHAKLALDPRDVVRVTRTDGDVVNEIVDAREVDTVLAQRGQNAGDVANE